MIIEVRHNIEVAHRLSLLKGKCENIHGHSMWVALRLRAAYKNDKGILANYNDAPLEFGGIKRMFRGHLDDTYDHHLLLNKSDPWAKPFALREFGEADEFLPGLHTFNGDPSTENIALWIAEWASGAFACDAKVKVQETAVNAATMECMYRVAN